MLKQFAETVFILMPFGVHHFSGWKVSFFYEMKKKEKRGGGLGGQGVVEITELPSTTTALITPIYCSFRDMDRQKLLVGLKSATPGWGGESFFVFFF